MKQKIAWICIALAFTMTLVGCGWGKPDDSSPSTSSSTATDESGEPVGTPNKGPTADQKPAPESTSSSTESTSSSASSEQTEAVTSVPTEGEASDVGGESMVRGKIVDASTSSIVVAVEGTGQELYFMRETADVTGSLLVDATVELYYTGTLSGTDTSGVYVTRIVALPG